MKNIISLTIAAALALSSLACDEAQTNAAASAARSGGTNASPPAQASTTAAARKTGKNTVVDVALGSKDHTTLVAALTAANYVDSLDNPGPFTVFAPTNGAFEKLPPGTVEGLVKPDKQADLQNILKYHVAVSRYSQEALTDGMVLGMANGGKATIKVADGKVSVNGASIVASVQASNGIVHVVDAVLLPPAP